MRGNVLCTTPIPLRVIASIYRVAFTSQRFLTQPGIRGSVMRDSAFGPVTIPAEFWSRPDVTQALTHRDFGELFRLLTQWTGLSQTRIGAATGNAQGRI